MIDALTLAAIAIAVTVIAGYPSIQTLQRLRVGKEISEWGPESHRAKAGTPTMGGLIIMLSVAGVTIAGNLVERWSIGLPLVTMASLCALGFVDDLGSLQGREQHAMTRRVKLAAFIAIGIAAAVGLYHEDIFDLQAINIPYHGREEIGLLYVPIAIAVIVLTAGGVAVTDGLDGLVAGCGAIAFGAYGFIAIVQEQTYLAAFCLTVAGALVGFLWHNSYPAKVFMGDTGALAIGGGLAVVAFLTGQWLVLPLIGIVFVAEGISVGLQIAYFRTTGGKRLFKMAPIHHHFEKSGWSEVQTTQRFWVVQALGSIAGVIFALEVYS